MESLNDYRRLSLNQATTQSWSLKEAIDGCAQRGSPISEFGVTNSAAGLTNAVSMVRDAGIHVSGLCRGGMFPAAAAERTGHPHRRQPARHRRSRRTQCRCAGAGLSGPNRDIAAARTMVADAIATLIPYARECGVRLGIEPLHPMYAANAR
jgi:sugar phosphate isomerase/epimerase